jgi:Flp pilus assembly protein TadD/cold shock CspA family protein
VAELAISETDLIEVQEFVAEQFRDLQPADFHHILPTFKWRGIATTNYDCVVEEAYRAAARPTQQIVPFLSNRDRVDDRLHSPDSVGLLKLHGCVTRTHEPEIPLILTAEQYVTHRRGRDLVFKTFEGWAYQCPVVFVGHGMQDSDLRAALMEASRELDIRPRCYLVTPDADEAECRLWDAKRISVLKGTFHDFLQALDRAIPAHIRPLISKVDNEHPIKRRFAVNEPLATALTEFIANDVEYVAEGMPIQAGIPSAFYKGFDLGWYPIAQNMDVRRHLTDTVLNDVIIRAEEDRPTVAELYLIKAEAGAGKSVFLRRLAWEAALDANVLCLFFRPFGRLEYEPIRELHRVTKSRVFLFVDNAADNAVGISSVLENARRNKTPVTIVTAERSNEWNMAGDPLIPHLTEAFPLRYLNHSEIEKLVCLLEQHNTLGPYLANKTFEQQVLEFEEHAGRQILVALHEATTGLCFEDILVDEFNSIQPLSARSLYLTVCVLNRMGVPVRAGLVARVHKIPFEKFQQELFAPLEHVVGAIMHSPSGDYMYTARHREIAQIVFERVLRSPADRYNEYVRIIRELNIAFNSDRDSLRGLVRAKSLHELFSNYEDVSAIFDVACSVAGNEAYLYQQMANYERIRPNGNYEVAYQLLQRARDLDPRDSTITHTLAELARTQALACRHPLERERYRAEARRILAPLASDPQSGRYARITVVKLAVDSLDDVIGSEGASDRQIDTAIRAVEEPLQRALQLDSSDPFLLAEEARFRKLMEDHARALRALERAFAANPRDPYIAARLARVYEERRDFERACCTLRAALEGRRGDKQLNYRYAMVLRESGTADHATLLYHLARSFTEWDANLDAQFWYARYLYESRDGDQRRKAKEIFKRLRDARMPHDARIEIRDHIAKDGQPEMFAGTIARREATHGFINRDGVGDYVFFHRNGSDECWDRLLPRARVEFNVGFSFGGPQAINIRPI